MPKPRAFGRWTLPLLFLTIPVPAASSAKPPASRPRSPSSGEPTGSRSGRVVEFAPGIVIDWGRRRVEITGKICLRQGLLELLACLPNTREHESIVVTPVRSLRLYQALGLIGLTPGKPVRFDPAKRVWLPPKGERLRIQVRYRDGRGAIKTVDASHWMRAAGSGDPIEEIEWLFAGSYADGPSRLAAEGDGTIVAVVDFSSALIARAGLHTADNSALELSAATDRIPPIGTPVTLLISGFGTPPGDESRPLVVLLNADSTVTWSSSEGSIDALADRLKQMPTSDRPERFVISVHPGAPADAVARLKAVLSRFAPGPSAVSVRRLPTRSDVDDSPAADDSPSP